MSNAKKIALGASAAAVALGVSLGVTGIASATETTTTPAPSSTSSAAADTPSRDGATGGPANGAADGAGKDHKGGHGRGGGVDAAALATKLGVDEATVTDALETARDAARTSVETAEGERPDREALQSAVIASLAETLGVDEASVQSAIDELEAEKKAERSAVVQELLDAAVTDGSLTQAEADGAAKAVELGILGGGKGRG
jgi:hypothetical protein